MRGRGGVARREYTIGRIAKLNHSGNAAL
jgi:hypothetical protein